MSGWNQSMDTIVIFVETVLTASQFTKFRNQYLKRGVRVIRNEELRIMRIVLVCHH
jgi:hypothetical protein